MKTGVYIYTRVSTDLQSDNNSLPAQRDAIKKYADYKGFQIVREYCDNGVSGKNIKNREEFRKMLEDIENNRDGVKYVMVFKLSRFGRNAADTLQSLQFMQDYGVNLISVTDNLDSSVAAGKMIITMLSAMAEMERENILDQTMSGRKQKAREGKWNGGMAPFGYDLIDGKLVINEEDARVVRDIFNIYLESSLGGANVAKELNLRYAKKKRKTHDLDRFTIKFVKNILDNPVYCGQIAYCRRTTEKINGTRNEFHVVWNQNADSVIVAQGQHEPIIDMDTWDKVRLKRQQMAGVKEKLEVNHEYIFSSLLRCPDCGGRMYGRPNGRKYKKDGTLYDFSYSYVCRHNSTQDGHICNCKTQYSEAKLEQEIKQIIIAIVNNKNFGNLINKKLDNELDEDQLKKDLSAAEKDMRRFTLLQARIEDQLLEIDYEDKNAQRKEDSLNRQLEGAFNKIQETQDRIDNIRQRMSQMKQREETKKEIYEFLLRFGEIYDIMEDSDKKILLKELIESIELNHKTSKKGLWIKAVHFQFPMVVGDVETTDVGVKEAGFFPPNEKQDESIVLLSKLADDRIALKIDPTESKKAADRVQPLE